MSEAYPYWESSVASQLGVSRDDIRKMRDDWLERGAHWEMARGKVCYSEAGVDVLKGRLAAMAAVPEPVLEKNAAAPGGKVERLLVWNAGLKNRHIVMAYKPGTDPAVPGNLLRVWVKSADNFRRVDGEGKPMELPVVHKQADFYELVGPCPRRPGRW